jgi:pyruvate dehydrogenase E1 component beta subunit
VKFREAVRDATMQAMGRDPNVFLIGVGIIDPRAVWGTLTGVLDRFGPDRVIEGPLAENALTGVCVGAATLGMRPILIHHRIDFVLLTMDQLINHAAKWKPMFGGQQSVPMVVRAVVGRGWGNGPSTPRATMPSLAMSRESRRSFHRTLGMPRDSARAIEDDDPVVYIEHRWLHEDEADVGTEYFTTPIGRATVVRRGRDVTIVAAGPMVSEALKAAKDLESSGILAEVIDLRTLRPLDADTVIASVAKTGRLVVADSDWAPCGVAGEIIAGWPNRRWTRFGLGQSG